MIQAAIRCGTAKKFDHAQLVHQMWTDIVLNHMQVQCNGVPPLVSHFVLLVEVYVRRVTTSNNIADLPSRPSARHDAFMAKIGARRLEPVLPERYVQAETWQVLVERWHAHGM